MTGGSYQCGNLLASAFVRSRAAERARLLLSMCDFETGSNPEVVED